MWLPGVKALAPVTNWNPDDIFLSGWSLFSPWQRHQEKMLIWTWHKWFKDAVLRAGRSVNPSEAKWFSVCNNKLGLSFQLLLSHRDMLVQRYGDIDYTAGSNITAEEMLYTSACRLINYSRLALGQSQGDMSQFSHCIFHYTVENNSVTFHEQKPK